MGGRWPGQHSDWTEPADTDPPLGRPNLDPDAESLKVRPNRHQNLTSGFRAKRASLGRWNAPAGRCSPVPDLRLPATLPAEGNAVVESARGAVPVLPPARFPGPLAEPAVPVSRQRALHGSCRQAGFAGDHGAGILFPR